MINKRVLDRERDKQKFQSKIAQTTEKLNLELEMKLTDHKRKVEVSCPWDYSKIYIRKLSLLKLLLRKFYTRSILFEISY